MPSFTKGGAPRTPFGKNVYLFSTRDTKYKSYSLAKDTVPYQLVDGSPQKILQPGTVLAKITSGPNAGKVGPYQASGTAEVQTVTPTTVTAGTFTLTVTRPVDGLTRTTAPIAFNASAADVQAALIALDNVEDGDIAVTGGPANSAALTFTYYGNYAGNVNQIVVDTTNLTGTMAAATTTAGVAGAADGRQTSTNIVGINDTWLPWQLMDHDWQVAVLYDGVVVQGNCFELNAAGVAIACQTATAQAMNAKLGMNILFQ